MKKNKAKSRRLYEGIYDTYKQTNRDDVTASLYRNDMRNYRKDENHNVEMIEIMCNYAFPIAHTLKINESVTV